MSGRVATLRSDGSRRGTSAESHGPPSRHARGPAVRSGDVVVKGVGVEQGQDALEIEPRLDAAAVARRYVRARLAAWGLDELTDPVLLLTSELVTNGLLHSGAPLVLSVERDGVGVLVDLADGSSVPPVKRRQSSTAMTGRGVQLLDLVADSWGWTPTDTGKRVWFRVTADGAWAPTADAEGRAGL